MKSRLSGFYVVAFGIDGRCEGKGFWARSKLSSDLIGLSGEFLRKHGEIFNNHFDGELKSVSLQLTSSLGAAIGTYSVNGIIAASVLMLSGKSPESDMGVAQMFISSIRKSSASTVGQLTEAAFGDILSFEDRPLMAVVPWPSESLSDDEFEMVQEISLHVGAAFFDIGDC